MPHYLGIDTSNYTTSLALYDGTGVIQAKRLLPVKKGERGLRQSDAVFHHTVQLPAVMQALGKIPQDIIAVGASVKPRGEHGSYMPCFLCGQSLGRLLSQMCHIPFYETHHQMGHILAALYSANSLAWLVRPFLAFHVSGGTTDCVLCTPDSEEILSIKPVSSSLDAKAGQMVDRVGVMLGLDFPCGKALEQLAMQSRRTVCYRPTIKGLDCCLSGLENQCRAMYERDEPHEDIARFCLLAIAEVIHAMTEKAFSEIGEYPIVYAGGVMSDTLIQERLQRKQAVFASPEYSCDNAVGVAIATALCHQKGVSPCLL